MPSARLRQVAQHLPCQAYPVRGFRTGGRQLKRAFELYKSQREFSAMRRAAMALDFDWGRSAKDYLDLYRELGRIE